MQEPRNCTRCGVLFDKSLIIWTANLCKACQALYEKERRARSPYKLRICRVCGLSSDETKFSPRRTICGKCDRARHSEQRSQSDKLYRAKKKNNQEFLANNRARQSRYLQSSPEAWICNCWHNMRVSFKKRGITIGVNIDYLRELYKQQNGLCALTGLLMTYKVNDMKSISVDRINSNIGYIGGNIQLVCRWVNLAKNNHTNEEFTDIINELKSK